MSQSFPVVFLIQRCLRSQLILGEDPIVNKNDLTAENEKLFTLLEVTTRKLDGVIHEIVATVSAADELSP